MKITKVCQEYCIGCGLCKSEHAVEFTIESTGYLRPHFDKEEGINDFLINVCPISGTVNDSVAGSVWGEYTGAYGAYSSDADIRKKASSGGVLTTLAIFLLEKNYVDAIIHVVADEENPTETMCQISTTREDVLACCGSRYSISSPWLSLSQIVEKEKKYAAIGKPCDIMALRKLKNYNHAYDNILYLMSFFCAGLPSKAANEQLLYKLGCAKETCKKLTYRGNGWPGYTTAIDKDGKEYTMEYSSAWGGVLGRDVHPFCKVCLDGIGLAADIACGDGWYITQQQTPDFTEHDGRNIVLVRTGSGNDIYKEAVKSGYIVSENWEDVNQLEIIQKYQFTRRTTMQDRLRAYKMFFKPVPLYDGDRLKWLARKGNKKMQIKFFLGTVKRILQKRL